MDAERLRAVLGGVAPEAGTDAASQQLAAHFALKRFARGAPLLKQGAVWGHAHVIESGLVRMHFVRRDGREFNKNFFSESVIVCPLTPRMWEGPSQFAITAVEPTAVWCCNANLLRNTLDKHGAWAPLQRALMVRLLDAKLQREHDLLSLTGRQRYDAFLTRHPAWASRVPLVQLATYLGLTDVSLSRLRRQDRVEPVRATDSP